MGLFSKKKVYVSSVVYPMGEEFDKIPDVVKASVITAGFRGESRARAIDKSIFEGQGIKLRQGYNYAVLNYYAGLPDGFPVTHLQPNDQLLNLLCKEYLEDTYAPAVVDLKTVEIAYESGVETLLRQHIEANYNYDFFAGEVHTGFGSVVAGAGLVYEPLDQDLINHPTESGWEFTFTNPDLSEVVMNVWYPNSYFENDLTVTQRISMLVEFDGGPAETIGYIEGGSFARLNIYLRNLITPQSGTFPAIVLKKDNVYLDDDDFVGVLGGIGGGPWQDTAAYKTSRAYGKRMGIDIDELLAIVKDNANEKDIDYCFVQPGTIISSPTQAAAEYHFNYFMRLYASYPSNKTAFENWVAVAKWPENGIVSDNLAKNCPAQSFRIQDPDDARSTVDIEIAWRYISYEEKAGALPTKYQVECGAQDLIEARNNAGKENKNTTYDCTKLYLRKRLTDSTYAELTVCGLWHENYVYKNKKSVQSGVWDMFNDEEGDYGTGFIIPLEYEVYLSLGGRSQLQLAQESLHIVFNCYKVVKQKWYQTGIFKVVLAIIGAVIIYFSWGTLTAQVTAAYTSILAAVSTVIVSVTIAAAVAAVLTVLVVAATMVGVSFLAREAGEWAAEQWGPGWGAVVQIVTTVALMWAAGSGFESISGASLAPATLAESVLVGSSILFSAMATYTSAQMKELQEKQKQWYDYIGGPDNPLKEIEQMMEEMFPENWKTDAALEGLFGAPKETLDEFLGRTLSTTDALTYGLTMPISHMAQLTLTPRLS